MRWSFLILMITALMGCSGSERSDDSAVGFNPRDFDASAITSGHTPVRVLITKTGWRSGQAALVLDNAQEVSTLYNLMAENGRIAYTCGYHWLVTFQYSDGQLENIAINEKCEHFQRDSKLVVVKLDECFARAKAAPTHRIVEATRKNGVTAETLAREARRFGIVFADKDAQYAVIASTAVWTSERLKQVRALSSVAAANVPKEEDIGN